VLIRLKKLKKLKEIENKIEILSKLLSTIKNKKDEEIGNALYLLAMMLFKENQHNAAVKIIQKASLFLKWDNFLIARINQKKWEDGRIGIAGFLIEANKLQALPKTLILFNHLIIIRANNI